MMNSQLKYTAFEKRFIAEDLITKTKYSNLNLMILIEMTEIEIS